MAARKDAKKKPRSTQATNKKKAAARPRGSRRHPSVAQTLRRNQAIVIARDVDMKTWAQIARDFKVREATAREGYRSYVLEIAPLFANEDALEKAHEFIRKLEGIQQRFAMIASTGKNESVKMGALRELVNTMWREIELRQHLSMLPKNLGDLTIVSEYRWLMQKVVELLEKHDAPQEAFEELADLVSPRSTSRV